MNKILSAAVAAAMLTIGMPAFADDGLNDGTPPSRNLGYTHLPGADMEAEGEAPSGGGADDQYLFLAGSSFTPRLSSQTVTYHGAGCTASTAAVTTSLELPEGSVIHGVRLYYYNVEPAGSVMLFLTTYPGDGSSYDRLQAVGSDTAGYVSEYFPMALLTVDNLNRSHVLTGTMTASARLCGMRVFYAR